MMLSELGLLKETDHAVEGLMAELSVRWRSPNLKDANAITYLQLHPNWNPNMNVSELEPDAALTGEKFALWGAGILGYAAELDFTEPIDFLHSLHIDVPKGVLSDKTFFILLEKLVAAPAKSRQSFFDLLLERGFMRDYNEKRMAEGLPPAPLIFEGKARPIFAYDTMIRECVYVESQLDTDQDGMRDLIKVWITRPLLTAHGMKAPVILEASPYTGGIDFDHYHINGEELDYDTARYRHVTNTVFRESYACGQTRERTETLSGEQLNTLPPARITKRFAGTEDMERFEKSAMAPVSGNVLRDEKYMTVRGFASAMCGVTGSKGCQGLGDAGGEREKKSVAAVIDWFCGRGKAYTNETDCIEVVADWCSGAVAMTGQSYSATTAIAQAFSGIEGLKTIVERAGISSWYSAYRSNGLAAYPIPYPGEDMDILQQGVETRAYGAVNPALIRENEQRIQAAMEMESGDYNAFWDERNYMNGADRLKASVFVVHGLNDWTVRTQCGKEVWDAASKTGVPVRMLLHQGEHMTPRGLETMDYDDMLNLWYTAFLMTGEQEMISNIPKVQVQNNLNQDCWSYYETWPPKEMKYQKQFAAQNGALAMEKTEGTLSFTSDLQATGFERRIHGEQNCEQWKEHIIAHPEEKHRGRIAFTTAPLERELHICGTTHVEIKAALSRGSGILSAMLVDYGESDYTFYGYMRVVDGGYEYLNPQKTVEEKAIPQGGGLPPIDLIRFEERKEPYKIITRGWMDVRNRKGAHRADLVKPGESYSFRLNLMPMDYRIKEGHRLGLVIYSADVEATFWPEIITEFKLDCAGTFIELPIL